MDGNGSGMAGPEGRAVRIAARDGFDLGATIYGGPAGAALVIHGATGVPQRFYREFAQYFAARGAVAVTFDYRGVGASRPARPLARVRASMGDWGRLDAAAVLDWVAERYPGRLWAVCHSYGGQCLGLLPNAGLLERVAMVGSQSGCWSDFALRDRPGIWLGAHAVIPGLSRALGYFPASKMGLGEDLPQGVALEWAKWMRSRHYLFDHVTADERRSYDRFAAPILAYKVSDDRFASGNSVDKLLRFYPAARPLLRTVTPRELGVARIGHFGAFRPQFRDTLWGEMYAWLALGRAPAVAAA